MRLSVAEAIGQAWPAPIIPVTEPADLVIRVRLCALGIHVIALYSRKATEVWIDSTAS